LTTFGVVQLYGDFPKSFPKVTWSDGTFEVVGDFSVSGNDSNGDPYCARIGNLEICSSYIKNNNGDIQLIPGDNKFVNVQGSLFVTGGSMTANVNDLDLSSGESATLKAESDVTIQSSQENVIINAGNQGTVDDSAATSGAIVFNASDSLYTSYDIPFQYGSSCNYVKGTSTGFLIGTCTDLIFDVPTSNKVVIPENVILTFGDKSNSSTGITYDSTSLNIESSLITQKGDIVSSGGSSKFFVDDVRFDDPILTLGGVEKAEEEDIRDRGIEFNYNKSGSSDMGWFGWKNETERFTFYSLSNNVDEVISGTIGDMEVDSFFVNDISFQTKGNIDLQCGTLMNVNKISSCNDDLTIASSKDVTIYTPGTLELDAGTSIQVPNSTRLHFGDTSTSIQSSSSGQLLLFAEDKIILDSNVQINGTMESVYSTVVNINDPIITVGGVDGVTFDDNKDRGIEFRWYEDGGEKLGFFGFKDDTQRFVFISEGTNENEVFTGDLGSIEIGDLYSKNIEALTLSEISEIYMQNGNISGIEVLSGGSIEIKTTEGSVSLIPTSGSNVFIPFEVAF
jgi:hypothetical protein